MTDLERLSRTLRPGELIRVGHELWVLDKIQPVAAVVDLVGSRAMRLVSWSEVPPSPSPSERRARAGADGLWVQQPGGPVVMVGSTGVRSGHHAGDLYLGAASAHGAWCVRAPRAQDIAATPDAPPSDYRDSDELRLARPGQVTATVRVDAPVVSLWSEAGDLYVEVEDGTWMRQSLGTPTCWALKTGTRWLRLHGDEPVPERLTWTEHGCAEPASTPDTAYAGGRDSLEVDGVVWSIVTRPGLRHPYAWPRPTDLTRTDLATGVVESVLTPDSIDISELCWPLPEPPLDAQDYAAFWADRLGGLDTFWTDESGSVWPLSDGLSQSRVDVVGAWPRTELHITFALASRPGVRLRRVVTLYDDLGRAAPPEYAGVHLMEALETGGVPAGPVPETGYLDL